VQRAAGLPETHQRPAGAGRSKPAAHTNARTHPNAKQTHLRTSGDGGALALSPQADTVDAFFQDLYRSTAEPLPENVNLDDDGENAAAAADSLWTASAVGEGPLAELLAKLNDPQLRGVPIRHLNPGRPHDLYWQYLAWFEEVGSAGSVASVGSEAKAASWATFSRVWLAPQYAVAVAVTVAVIRCSSSWHLAIPLHQGAGPGSRS